MGPKAGLAAFDLAKTSRTVTTGRHAYSTDVEGIADAYGADLENKCCYSIRVWVVPKRFVQ